jgi:tetratricopeptide (TPR) repeat protein
MNLFEGRDIRVVPRLFDESSDELVVTFTGRAADPPVEKGFGETYLQKKRVSAVHFISKDNHWWQTPEPMQAIVELRRQGLIGGNRRVTLYGSSMGGYAALILSQALSPARIVLFSPQYSIDAKRVPFEKRWRNYAAKLKFDYDNMEDGIDKAAQIKAVYDPFFAPDRKHIELIEKLRPIEHVPVSFAGHNTARTLGELGIITQVIDSLILDKFDLKAFEKLYRNLRPASSLFWHGLSQTLAEFGHRAGSALASTIAAKIVVTSGRMKDPQLRNDILRQAIADACAMDMPHLGQRWLEELEAVGSADARLFFARATVARANGDWLQADRHIDEARRRNRNDAEQEALKLETLHQTAGANESANFASQTSSPVRRSAPFLLAQAHNLIDLQDWSQALEVLRQYFRHDGREPSARMLCAYCWSKLGRPDAAVKQLAPILQYNIASEKLAGQICDLVEKGGSIGLASRIGARHKQFQKLFQALMNALDSANWRDPKQVANGLRASTRSVTGQVP